MPRQGSNAPPVLKSGQKDFIWNRQPPYAGQYTTQQGGTLCGTQATRCWKVYKLTDQLNTQWRAKLAGIQSVFANYQLIGTNWGGDVEPTPGTLANGAAALTVIVDEGMGSLAKTTRRMTSRFQRRVDALVDDTTDTTVVLDRQARALVRASQTAAQAARTSALRSLAGSKGGYASPKKTARRARR